MIGILTFLKQLNILNKTFLKFCSISRLLIKSVTMIILDVLSFVGAQDAVWMILKSC